METAFLTLDDVVAIHRDQIERYGGSLGVARLGLAKVRSGHAGGGFRRSVSSCRYLRNGCGLLVPHRSEPPFIDGNKRVGAVAADVFLALNDLSLVAGQDEYAELVLALARGECSKSGIAEFLRTNTEPAS